MAPARRALLGAAPAAAVVVWALLGAAPVQAYSCATVPVGRASPSAEPMQPAWCLGAMAAEPTTRQLDPWGGWQDSFQTNVQAGHLNDGDMGYRVFDGLSNGGEVRTRHFVNDNHWMVDMSRNNGGAAISPNRAFHFQNGRLVLEADVAAGVPGYFSSQGDIVWPEVVWSTSPTPTARIEDGLYLYGHFGGQWAGGCRLDGERNLICALEADHPVPTDDDRAPCFSQGEARVLELSAFEACGGAHSGFAVDFGAPGNAWRRCQPNQSDLFCRDRFRFEWSQSGFVAYVNGVEFARDQGWPGYAQIPAGIVSGRRAVYAFFGEWGDFTDSGVYRFHWGRLAVNPHDASGSPLAPSAAASYCPGQPQDTCPTGTQAPAPAGMPAIPAPVTSDAPAPAPGTGQAGAPGAGAPGVQTHAFLAGLLNSGQQPMFWVLLGVTLAAAAAVAGVRRLWSARPRL
ncbi:MAG TPA: hypothetical protein VLW53_02595 [Candidatus Eisenbacteria bacterium]|nr:hypothetical protein [Candidatus Eisenbacteria bacterium]